MDPVGQQVPLFSWSILNSSYCHGDRTRTYNLRISDLQMSIGDLTRRLRTGIRVLEICSQRNMSVLLEWSAEQNFTLGNQNAQLLSERPIHEKRNVRLTTFWSKWRKKQSGVLVWCWITNIYWGIYGDNHAHGTRKHFGKGLVTGRQDSRHTVFLIVCTANATSCYRHIC